jgi:HD-like signal output (HDOD) protein/CheY-like chemotaxis protein
MGNLTDRALVVDDEAAVRNLTIRALQREGFSCDAAVDGVEAEKLIRSQRYDVVVTDLKMPNKNGHALASELLVREDRPLVVILTGVLEPRLTKDLTARGVDCIEFKPVNPLLFAAKIKALVDRRRQQAETEKPDAAPPPRPQQEEHPPHDEDVHPGITMIRKRDLDAKLLQLSKILPVSPAAMEIFNMTNAGTCENSRIAASTAHDASLSLDILKLANSSFYNYSRKKVVALEEAILRIGQKRVGELALATSTMAALTTTVLPWINTELTWRRSLAAGVAIDHLLSEKGIPNTEHCLFMSAIMHSLGRIALGMLYPQQYQQIIQCCRERHQAIETQERLYFPMTPEAVMGDLLKIWNIPVTIYEPLQYASHPYSALSALGDPLGMQVELLKIAILIARIAVGMWDPWDLVELPPAHVLDRLGIGSYWDLIRKTETDLEEIIRFRDRASESTEESKKIVKTKQSSCALPYCNMSTDPFDFLGALLIHSGVELQPCTLDALEPGAGILVNCIGCPPHRLVAQLNANHCNPQLLLVTIPSQSGNYSRFGQVLSLPADYGSLQEACSQMAANSKR